MPLSVNFNSAAKKDRKIDIVFCIDATGSMSPCIDSIKANAKKFYLDFVETMTNDFNSNVEEVNLKVISFRDYTSDSFEEAMQQSEWFELSAGDDDKYQQCLDSIIADGGGDAPENGLEALFYAMTTDWKARGSNDRQVIVLFTDADAIPFGTQMGEANYPKDMVDMDGLLSTWMCKQPGFISQSDFKLKDKCKRLVMFGPAGSIYEDLAKKLERSQFIPVVMDSGLGELDFDNVIKIIAASASTF